MTLLRPLYVFVAIAFASAAAWTDDIADGCANLNRLRMLLLAPLSNHKSFQEVAKECESNIEPVSVGNLKEINPEAIIAELQHEPLNAGGARSTSDTGPSVCRTKMSFIAECIKGVTSEFHEKEIRVPFDELKKRKVISVGEGFVGTVVQLVESGVDAYGIDFHKSYKDKSHSMLKGYEDRHAWGDATRLTGHEFLDNPPDHIISFCLICALGPKKGVQAIVEGVKGLKVGGDLRFAFYYHDSMPDKPKAYTKMMSNAAKALEKEGIAVDVFSARVDYLFPNSEKALKYQFFMFRRVEQGQGQKKQSRCP